MSLIVMWIILINVAFLFLCHSDFSKIHFSSVWLSVPHFIVMFLITCSKMSWLKQNKTQPYCSFTEHSKVHVKEGLLYPCVFCTWNVTLSGYFFPLFVSGLKCFFLRKCFFWHMTTECNVIITAVFYTLQSWTDIWNIHFHFCNNWAEL